MKNLLPLLIVFLLGDRAYATWKENFSDSVLINFCRKKIVLVNSEGKFKAKEPYWVVKISADSFKVYWGGSPSYYLGLLVPHKRKGKYLVLYRQGEWYNPKKNRYDYYINDKLLVEKGF